MSNRLALDVERILREALGEFVAHATLKKNCELIGVTPDDLECSQLPKLAGRIEKSVSFLSVKRDGDAVGGPAARDDGLTDADLPPGLGNGVFPGPQAWSCCRMDS